MLDMLPLKKNPLPKIRISQLLYELQSHEKCDWSQKILNAACFSCILIHNIVASKAVCRCCFCKKVFCKYAANLQENTHAEVSF